MRALTDSEARVIAVLLAARPDRERERLRQVEIPRSTYHAVRRRAYEEGWLRDRYIPDPVPLGRPHVTFLLARPYADRFPEFTRAVTADDGNVVLWNGSQLAVAVFFHRKPTDGARLGARLEKDRSAASPLVITVAADGPTVPVFFDFEGLWCHLAQLEGTLAYPHGLGGAVGEGSGSDETELPPLSAHQIWALGELLRRPFTAADQGRGGHLVGPFGLPFSQRRMLAKGWITHRTLLEPARLPAYQGRSADQIVLISGTPKKGARPEELFSTLTRDCRVFPFLFVVGTERWLLGALGGAGPAAAPDVDRRAVLPTLRDALEGIEILQEPASEFMSPVDHRYERLLPAPPGPATTKP
ncbi:MAG: hypothetical protein WA691_05380 [Thermoplasmata archaeon]